MHTSQAEQDKRLKERIETPWIRWKTGLDDYHNRSMRAEYLDAYHDVFERTSTPNAPWHVIAANDKKWARIRGLEIVAQELSAGVNLDYPKVSAELKKVAEKALGKKLDV
jgi:polyphosphate kinase 2 (PPK2 family)